MNPNKIETKKVFTPTTPATFTYVDRPNVTDQLVDALMTPGQQIIIYGYTGCGKTTIILKKLKETYENSIRTSCTKGMTFQQIMINAFDQLNKFYVDTKSNSYTNKINVDLLALYLQIKAEKSNTTSDILKRILPVQLTAQRLAQFIGETKSCWILEDFHKVDEAEKPYLTQIMKVFMDMANDYLDLKIIAIGAVNTAREIVQYDNEMQHRISEIYVPLMNIVEIEKIIDLGQILLNIEFDRTVKNKITLYSSGLASICHHLCLSMCFSKRIYETVDERVFFNESDLQNSIDVFLNRESDSLKKVFEKATKIERNIKFNNPKIILLAIIDLRLEEFCRSDILKKIKKEYHTFPSANLTKYLKEFCLPTRGEVLRYNENSNLYSFSNPFLKAFIQFSYNKDRINIDFPKISASEMHAYLKAKIDMEEDMKKFSNVTFYDDIDVIDNIDDL